MLLLCQMGSALYRNELRHLPEKLRQERIQTTVSSVVKTIQERVIQTASSNHTYYQFPLFCMEPNIAQAASRGSSLYQHDGNKYTLSDGRKPLTYPLLPKPECETKYGYELYQKWEEYRNFQQNYDTDRTHYNEMLQKLWPIVPLEVSPTIYIQRFFELFNQAFPDIHLDISFRRPSQGIFDTECCPLYNVSW